MANIKHGTKPGQVAPVRNDNAIELFRTAIAAAGLTPPDDIHPDGKIHRFSSDGRRGDSAGWYVLHMDGVAAGKFGCWRSSLESTWCAKSPDTMTATEREAHQQRIQTMKAQRDADVLETQQQARQTAAALLQKAKPATEHPYLTVKGIKPHGVTVHGDKLLIPMRDTAGQLHSLQTISPDGDKRFHPGGRVKGCYHAIGKPAGVLVLCEGYATGASIHECTEQAVAVAFNAGNLESVATALREKYPDMKIVIAGDDDFQTPGNPGLTKATAAAQAIGGWLAMPSFPAGRGDKDGDFNDLHKLLGADAVKAGIDTAVSFVPGGTTPGDADTPDNHRNAPRPSPDCLHGLIGDIARAGSVSTEANPFAIAANTIAFMGCAVGRGPFMSVGNTWHHARQFTLHIGRSGRGRKGDATTLVSRIEWALRGMNADATPQVHRGGLSSREGLVFLIHDGYKEGKNEVEAVLDKRLMVIESEFANILMQSRRDGNTLSSALRDCWDGVSMKPATKSSRLWATEPHVSLAAAITPGELHSLMASRDLTNGFANRFLMFWAEKTKSLAFPSPTPQTEVDALARRVLEVLEFCNATRWAEKNNLRVSLSPDARKRYEALYHGELNDNSAGERVTALIERRAPMLLRLAMLFALCDLTDEVQLVHINAALAWVRFSIDSVKFVFASAADEVATAETNDTAEKILVYLREKGEASRGDLSVNCFQKHATKARLDAALDELLSSNPPQITVESKPRAKGLPGNATKIYRVCAAKSAKSAKCEHSCGLAPDFKKCEVCEVCEVSQEICEVSPGAAQDFATLRTLRKGQKTAETRMDIDTSHTSHTSHADSENCEVDI